MDNVKKISDTRPAPAKSGAGIGTPDFHRDIDTPRACFLLSFALLHLRINGGACRGAERLAGR
ncbi:hypothetical protein FO014_00995 [Serratia rhizosphaerae]|uniref:Uncharacterized protein n=1 Tax=Serratia rhizosphaerae TaxID=2597702 RepID=A0ABX6GU37_9GAMM|nr:hypothetical protein FO014_00995 [Serratia rhizosphaerae]